MMKQKSTQTLLSVLLSLALVLGLLSGMGLTAFAAESVRYVDEAGRDMGVAMCEPVAQMMETGWYVSGNVTFENRIEVTGDVNLILADNTTLNLKSGIHVPDGAKLTIWAQSTGDSKGKLEAHNATVASRNAAIGGNSASSDDKGVEHTGEITVNGGYIYASGTIAGSGRTTDGFIDGGPGLCGKTVTVNGGEVKAYGEGRGSKHYSAAGISGDWVVINGGYVEAYGSLDCGAGIGGGAYEDGCDVTVTGGTVIAEGGPSAPGIGSGYEHNFTKTITVSGGTVKARSGSTKVDGAAGIGSGTWADFEGTVIISGGHVEAVSDTGGGAGIGAGRAGEATDGHVYISGGFVFAKGSSGGTAEREKEGGDDRGGAGIGGGRENIGTYIDKGGEGCDDVVITGGTVFAQSGNGRCSAIGHGDNDRHMGNIRFGDGMRVQTDSRTTGGVDGPYSNRDGNPYKANERDGACMYNHTALIHKCDHPMDKGVNDGYADVTADYHRRAACVYCGHAMQREAHTLDEENKCTVCGYQGAISTVTFDANGGSGDMDARKVIPGRTLILPACGFTSPSGKAFAGWEIGGQTYAPGKAVTINTDTTVKALWSRAYRLWVGEMQVTEDNAGDILGDGTAVYDRLNNTLTLTDAWIINGAVYDRDNTITAGIISELGGLQIVANGESVVNTADAAYGIYAVGTLSIGGEGRLSARGKTGVGAGGDLDVSVSELIASGEQFGVTATGNITVSGSEVTAEGESCGMKATKNIGVSGKQSVVIASSTGAGYAIEAGEDIGFDADLAIVSPANGTVGNTDNGVTVLDENGDAAADVVIAKPVVYNVQVTPESGAVTFGDWPTSNTTLTLTATVTPEDGADQKVIWSVDGEALTLYTDADCKTPVDTEATDTLTVYAKGNSVGTATVTVTCNADSTKSASCEVKVSEIYDLWVGEIPVTSDDAADILGDGAVSYHAGTKTLTLRDADIIVSGDNDDGIGSAIDGLTVNGSGVIVSTGEDSNGICLYRGADLTLSGDFTIKGTAFGIFGDPGSVTVDGGEIHVEGGDVGINCNGNLTVKSGTLDVKANDYTDGVFAGNVFIEGGTVRASGPYAGIEAEKTIVITGGQVESAGDDFGLYSLGDTDADGIISIGDNCNVTAIGKQQALYGSVINAAEGTGWTDREGTEGEAVIGVSASGQTLSYKKVQFPGVHVEKPAAVPATVTANDRTWDGTAQPLVIVDASTLAGGTMYYAVTAGNMAPTDEEYTETVPSKTETGTYYVWYKVIGDENHKDTEPVSLSVKIAADMTALNAKISEATEYYNSIKADYPTIAETLNTAITAAKAVTDESQRAVDAAVTALNDAINTAKAAAKKLADDIAAAKAVEAKINAIGEVTYTDACKAKIDAARAAYDALTSEQKTLVENYNVLTAAEARYTELKAAAETPDKPDKPDTPSQPDQPSGNGSCKWCGEHHSGFWGSIVGFWHTIFYFWAHLFGLR